MDMFEVLGVIVFSCLLISFICYSATTNRIIKDQEKEISFLKTEVRRLKVILNRKGARTK